VTPEEALLLAKTVTDLYAKAAQDLLELIGRAVAKGLPEPVWARRGLEQILPLRRQAQAVVGRLQTAGPGEARRVIEEVYRLTAAPDGLSTVNTRAVAALAADTQRLLVSLGPPLLRWAEDVHRNVIAEVAGSTVIGATSRREAAARALQRYADLGVGGFTDSAGRRWQLDSYAEMATRTAVGRAHLAGTLHRFEDQGRLWVVVSNSPEECPMCRPFEGRILSIAGDVAPPAAPGWEYAGTLTAAIARGLFHPNCTHRLTAYIPGLSRPPAWNSPGRRTENPAGYVDRQRQRELERRVRESKRRVAALRPLGDTPELRRQEALLTARRGHLNTFVNDHNRKKSVSDQRTRVTPSAELAMPAAERLVRPHVDRILTDARANEPAISHTMRQLTEAEGGTLERFAFRLKERDSLTRKLATEVLDGEDPAATAAGIKDAVRYTVVLDHDTYADGVRRWEAALTDAGYQIGKRPAGWRPAGEYQGLNVSLRAPSGQVFEVQFHTQASLDAAEAAHKLYEKARHPTTPAEERHLLKVRMATVFRRVPLPPGWQRIG